MEIKINDLMESIKSSLITKTYLALMDEDGKIIYNNFQAGLNRTLKDFVPALKLMDMGDYHIKNFAKTCLIIFKVSDRLALIAESYAKEGLLIFTLKGIAENLRNRFLELDILLVFSDMAEEEAEIQIAEQLI